MTESLRLDVADRIAQITIDRHEKRNALTSEMWARLLAHLRAIASADDVSAVVIFGSGGSFSAGRDLAEVRDAAHAEGHGPDLAAEVVASLAALPQPTLAAIDGPCFGAGCSLALACDIRICSPRSQFGIPVLKNGLAYADHLVHRLVQVVGPGPAGLLLLGGERWIAAEAVAHGLVDRCTEDVLAEADKILAGLRHADDSVTGPIVASLRSSSGLMPGHTKWKTT